MKVLIIDDNGLHLKMCRILLEKMGHTVYTAASMQELKNNAPSMSAPDIALVDFRLEPGVTGIDAKEYIRNEMHWQTKCIALTADVGEQANLNDAGFDGIIYKPVTEAQLADTLRRYE